MLYMNTVLFQRYNHLYRILYGQSEEPCVLLISYPHRLRTANIKRFQISSITNS